jgi:protein-tyrosine-phosphatase
MVIDIRDTPDPSRVLVVGRRNVRRSSAAEQLLLAHAVMAGLDDLVIFRSAGTCAAIGSPTDAGIEDAVRSELQPWGVPEQLRRRSHRARQLTERRLAMADLVLVTSSAERRQLLALRPQTGPVTFTITEYVRLSAEPGAGSPCDVAELVRRLDAERSGHRPLIEDDVDHAMGGPSANHRQMVQTLNEAAREIVRTLTDCVPRTEQRSVTGAIPR